MLLVCGDCRAELEAVGATVVLGPISITVGHPCAVHEGMSAQAMHGLIVSPEQRAAFVAARASCATAPAPATLDPDWREVAHVAAILAAAGEADDNATWLAVRRARELVAMAKGGA